MGVTFWGERRTERSRRSRSVLKTETHFLCLEGTLDYIHVIKKLESHFTVLL